MGVSYGQMIATEQAIANLEGKMRQYQYQQERERKREGKPIWLARNKEFRTIMVFYGIKPVKYKDGNWDFPNDVDKDKYDSTWLDSDNYKVTPEVYEELEKKKPVQVILKGDVFVKCEDETFMLEYLMETIYEKIKELGLFEHIPTNRLSNAAITAILDEAKVYSKINDYAGDRDKSIKNKEE